MVSFITFRRLPHYPNHFLGLDHEQLKYTITARFYQANKQILFLQKTLYYYAIYMCTPRFYQYFFYLRLFFIPIGVDFATSKRTMRKIWNIMSWIISKTNWIRIYQAVNHCCVQTVKLHSVTKLRAFGQAHNMFFTIPESTNFCFTKFSLFWFCLPCLLHQRSNSPIFQFKVLQNAIKSLKNKAENVFKN